MRTRSFNIAWLFVGLFVAANAEAQDVNNDGFFDCADVDLIGAAVRNLSDDVRFDFDNDGTVDYSDYEEAFDLAGFSVADINFDGGVDRLDYHPFGLHWQESVTSYCQGDLNYDGVVNAVDSGDMGLNWQRGAVLDNSPAATVNSPKLPSRLAAWHSGGFVFGESGPFELVATPKRAPDGLLTTVVAIRTKDPTHRISTFDHIEISGDAHQIWIPGLFGPVPTVTGMPDFLITSPSFAGVGQWDEADTQILFDESQIGVGAGQGFAGISETNDQSSPAEIDPIGTDTPIESVGGIGSIQMANSTDIFSLDSPFHTSYVELAQLVTPANSGESQEVFLTVGVQGGNANRDPQPFHDVFGIDDPLQVPFFSQPCDFDGNGYCDQQDLDRLTAALANGTEDADLNLDYSDPPLITQADVDAWHDQSDPIPGDTDYDGDVDAADLNNLALHWQNRGRTVTRWEDGDFDYSGTVGVIDLNQLGINWQHGVEPMQLPVPEPGFCALGLMSCLAFVAVRTCSRMESAGRSISISSDSRPSGDAVAEER